MKSVRFGDLCKLQNGRAFKPEEWSEEGTPIVRIQNLNDETKPFNYCNFDVEKRFWINSGDLLFSWSGTPGTSFGAFFWNRGKGFLNQHIFRVDVKEELVDKHYLRYALNSLIVKIIDQAHGGVGLKHITKAKLEEVQIPLPPLSEQRRIASILDQADELRQKRQQAIEKLDRLLQATFIDLFGDPVSNSKGWELVSAKNVLKIQGGYAFSSTDFSKSGIPVVKIGNANKFGFSTEKFDFIIPQYPEKLTQYELRSGDLLMSLTGTVGKDDYGNITEVTDDYDLYYLNQRVAKLEVINTLFSKNYIRYFFSQSSIKALITKNNRGVRQANISNSDLYELDIPLPTKAQLDKFDSFIESINETKRYSKVQLISSNKLFFALQNQAFSGTL